MFDGVSNSYKKKGQYCVYLEASRAGLLLGIKPWRMRFYSPAYSCLRRAAGWKGA